MVFFIQARHPQNPYYQEQVISQRFRGDDGTEMNTVGDGFLASFDGPAGAIRCAIAIVNA